MAAASPMTPGRHFVQSLFSPDYLEAQNYWGDAPSLTRPTQPTEPPVGSTPPLQVRDRHPPDPLTYSANQNMEDVYTSDGV
uniref:Uncharacterized protein n=1 Tax=Leersia perrieri TaxID=77586 RepID=A0A0D9WQI7_9ORYZ